MKKAKNSCRARSGGPAGYRGCDLSRPQAANMPDMRQPPKPTPTPKMDPLMASAAGPQHCRSSRRGGRAAATAGTPARPRRGAKSDMFVRAATTSIEQERSDGENATTSTEKTITMPSGLLLCDSFRERCYPRHRPRAVSGRAVVRIGALELPLEAVHFERGTAGCGSMAAPSRSLRVSPAPRRPTTRPSFVVAGEFSLLCCESSS